MPKFIHKSLSVKKEKELEIMQETIDKQAAIIDYIAMMAGVDIADEEIEMEGVAIDD
jgi:hypothetical protein